MLFAGWALIYPDENWPMKETDQTTHTQQTARILSALLFFFFLKKINKTKQNTTNESLSFLSFIEAFENQASFQLQRSL